MGHLGTEDVVDSFCVACGRIVSSSVSGERVYSFFNSSAAFRPLFTFRFNSGRFLPGTPASATPTEIPSAPPLFVLPLSGQLQFAPLYPAETMGFGILDSAYGESRSGVVCALASLYHSRTSVSWSACQSLCRGRQQTRRAFHSSQLPDRRQHRHCALRDSQ